MDVKKIKVKQDGIEKSFNQKQRSLKVNNKKHEGSYEKLFPNVMIDDDDENINDFDKAIDDMMFMDLMDED